jgi:hypothetical protein
MPTIDEDDDEVVDAAPLPTPSHGGGAPLPDSDDEAEPIPSHGGGAPLPASDDEADIDCRSDDSDGERVMYDEVTGFQKNQLGVAPPSLCSAGSFGMDGSPGSSSGAMGPSGPGGPPNVCDPAKTGTAKQWMGGSEVAEAPKTGAAKQWMGGSEIASQVPATSLGDVGNLADLQAAQSPPPTPPPPPRPTIGQPGGVSPSAAMPTGVSPPARAPPAYSRAFRRSMRPLQHAAAMNSSSLSAWNTPGHRARMGPVLMGNSCKATWHGSCNGHNSFSYSCDHLNGKFCGACCRASGGCSVHF